VLSDEFRQGALVINTSRVATDTVQYVAADPTGLTSMITIRVLVGAATPRSSPTSTFDATSSPPLVDQGACRSQASRPRQRSTRPNEDWDLKRAVGVGLRGRLLAGDVILESRMLEVSIRIRDRDIVEVVSG
jgi:hypothetical protein